VLAERDFYSVVHASWYNKYQPAEEIFCSFCSRRHNFVKANFSMVPIWAQELDEWRWLFFVKKADIIIRCRIWLDKNIVRVDWFFCGDFRPFVFVWNECKLAKRCGLGKIKYCGWKYYALAFVHESWMCFSSHICHIDKDADKYVGQQVQFSYLFCGLVSPFQPRLDSL